MSAATQAILAPRLAGRARIMVFAGSFTRGSVESGLAAGFRKLGWAVQQVELARYLPDLGEAASSRAIVRMLTPLSVRRFQSSLMDTVETLKPDLFLTIKGTHINAALLTAIRDRGNPCALFYPDVHFDHPGVEVQDFALYDVIVTSKSFQVAWLQDRFGRGKVAYVPHGYSPDVHWPILGAMRESDYTCDIQHVGGHTAYKQRWIDELLARRSGKGLRLVGPRWQGCDGFGGAEVIGALYDCAYSMALQSARINLAVMMGPQAPTGWEDRVSTRTFEIPACRSFMLHIDNEEIREFFTPGEEIDVFASADELADKVRFYLANPAVRERMIERAYARCVPAYSYDARARDILCAVQSRVAV